MATTTAIVLLLARVPLLTSRRFDPDELEHMHVAWCITLGLVPFRDFFEHHSLLLHYGLAAALPGFDVLASPEHAFRALFAARFAMWALSVGIVVATFLLAHALRGWTVAWVTLPLVSGSVVLAAKGIEIRPDGLATFLWLSFLLGFHSAHASRVRAVARAWCVASGLLLGLAVLASQKLLLAGPIVAVLMVWHVLDGTPTLSRAERLRGAMLLALAILAVWGGAVAFLAYLGAAGDALRLTVVESLAWSSELSPAESLAFIARFEPWLFGLALGGAVLLVVEIGETALRMSHVILLASAGGMFGGLFVIPVPFLQYCLTFMPLFAILAASFLVHFVEAPIRWSNGLGSLVAVGGAGVVAAVGLAIARPYVYAAAIYPVVVVCGVGAAIALSRLSQRGASLAVLLVVLTVLPAQWSRWMLAQGDGGQFAGLSFVMEVSSPNDTVMDGWSGYGVFRRHASYHWMLHPGVRAGLTPSDIDTILRDLRSSQSPPAVVILDSNLAAIAPDVTAFVRRRYSNTRISDVFVRRP